MKQGNSNVQARTLWDEPLGMLMASGSPGSALAYQLSQNILEPEMVRRTMAPEASPSPGNPAPVQSGTSKTQTKRDASPVASAGGWLGRLLDRLEAWSWERETREREVYLAQAQNLYDLEARMRHLDSHEFSRRDRSLG